MLKYMEKHPMIMVVIGILGVSLSSILVRYSDAPSVVTAAYRLLWTVALMTPVMLGEKTMRQEMRTADRKTVGLSCLSGVFLAVHFSVWFESLQHTSVASSATIVCTDVIWVCLGFCLFLKGKLSWKALLSIAVAFGGSVLIACADSSSDAHLYGDILALIAAIAAAVYTLLGWVVLKNTSTAVYTYIVYSACGAVLVCLCLIQGHGLLEYGMSPIIVGFLLAVFSTIMGHTVFNWCMKFFSPSFVTAAKLCEPVVAAILAVFLFDEIPAVLQLVGGALILGGVYAYSLVERKQE